MSLPPPSILDTRVNSAFYPLQGMFLPDEKQGEGANEAPSLLLGRTYNLRVQPHAERVGCNAGLGGFLPTIRPWSTCLQCGGIFLKPLIIMPTDLR